MNRIVLFTDPHCPPCGMVKRYFDNVKDKRIEDVEHINLYDNLEFAHKYGARETPTLVVINDMGGILDRFHGGYEITQNIRRILEEYHDLS